MSHRVCPKTLLPTAGRFLQQNPTTQMEMQHFFELFLWSFVQGSVDAMHLHRESVPMGL